MIQDINKEEFTIGEIMYFGWDIFTTNLSKYWVIFCSAILLYAVLSAFALQWFTNRTVGFTIVNGMYWQALGTFVLFALLIGLIQYFAFIYIIKLSNDAIEGKDTSVKDAFLFSLRRYFPTIGNMIIVGLFTLGLFLCLIIPGIIFALFWAFALWIIILKDVGAVSAIRESKHMVQGRWWETLGRLILVELIAIGCAIPAFIILAFVRNPLANSILSNLVSGFAALFIYSTYTVMYYNYDKVRLQNDDVETKTDTTEMLKTTDIGSTPKVKEEKANNFAKNPSAKGKKVDKKITSKKST